MLTLTIQQRTPTGRSTHINKFLTVKKLKSLIFWKPYTENYEDIGPTTISGNNNICQKF